jgi:hypothetical protein
VDRIPRDFRLNEEHLERPSPAVAELLLEVVERDRDNAVKTEHWIDACFLNMFMDYYGRIVGEALDRPADVFQHAVAKLQQNHPKATCRFCGQALVQLDGSSAELLNEAFDTDVPFEAKEWICVLDPLFDCAKDKEHEPREVDSL